MNEALKIKIADRAEIDIAVGWAEKEGWNPGLHDAEGYYCADPEGFLIGYLGDEPVATISAVRYGATFGFIGFYIVHEPYRGRGYGMQIWNAAMDRLEGRNTGLDGVIDQQDNYRKSGFGLAYRNRRYEGVGGGEAAAAAGLVNLSALPFATVDSYDRPFFPDDRSAFIESWVNQPGCVALGVVDDGVLSGYGVIRPCGSGYKIGPLFANNPETAETLFQALKARAPAKDPVFLDTPEVNEAAVSLAERNGMQVVFETARMYTDDAPDMPLERLFGVTSFEVG